MLSYVKDTQIVNKHIGLFYWKQRRYISYGVKKVHIGTFCTDLHLHIPKYLHKFGSMYTR